MIPFDFVEHNVLAMRVRSELAEDIDENGRLWMYVRIEGTEEHWSAVDSRSVGIYDAGGGLLIVSPLPQEAA